MGHCAFATQLRLPGTFHRMQRATIQTGARYPHMQQASPNSSRIIEIIGLVLVEMSPIKNKYTFFEMISRYQPSAPQAVFARTVPDMRNLEDRSNKPVDSHYPWTTPPVKALKERSRPHVTHLCSGVSCVRQPPRRYICVAVAAHDTGTERVDWSVWGLHYLFSNLRGPRLSSLATDL